MMNSNPDLSFHEAVQRLFFNVDISLYYNSLVDEFKKVPSLLYNDPLPDRRASAIYDGDIITDNIVIEGWFYYFTFTTIPAMLSRFDAGVIHLLLFEDPGNK